MVNKHVMQELEEVLVTAVELKQLLRVYTGKRSLVAQTRLLVLSSSLNQPNQLLQYLQTHLPFSFTRN